MTPNAINPSLTSKVYIGLEVVGKLERFVRIAILRWDRTWCGESGRIGHEKVILSALDAAWFFGRNVGGVRAAMWLFRPLLLA